MGKVVKRVDLEYPAETGRTMYQVRGVAQRDNGNIIVAHQNGSVVNEYSLDGKKVREIYKSKRGQPCSLFICPNGNIVIGLIQGVNSGVVEVDTAGKVVWQCRSKEASEAMQMEYITQVERLPNGNYLIANCYGHNKKKWAGLAIVEMSPDRKIVRAIGNSGLFPKGGGQFILLNSVKNKFVKENNKDE